MTRSAPLVEASHDPATGTVSYLLLDPSTRRCALIDSVLDFDMKSGRTRTDNADRLVARVRALGATVEWILETHVHADHLSAAQYLQRQLGGRIGIGAHIASVQRVFGELINEGAGFARDGAQFDRLFADEETFALGSLPIRVLHTPGHTPACLTYVVGEADATVAFVGDTLFMPDYGTARCDFPGGDARTLYRSIRRVLALPPATRLYLCHDYPSKDQAMRFTSTVAEQRAGNIHVRDGIDEETFVAMRTARDATLSTPVLMLPSVQVNMRAGRLPEREDNGVRYLKIPLDSI